MLKRAEPRVRSKSDTNMLIRWKNKDKDKDKCDKSSSQKSSSGNAAKKKRKFGRDGGNSIIIVTSPFSLQISAPCYNLRNTFLFLLLLFLFPRSYFILDDLETFKIYVTSFLKIYLRSFFKSIVDFGRFIKLRYPLAFSTSIETVM